jgi:hypothetical protein
MMGVKHVLAVAIATNQPFIIDGRSSFELFGHRPRQDRHLIEQRLAVFTG